MRRPMVASVVPAPSLVPVGSLAAEDEPPAGTFEPAGPLAKARSSHTATIR